MQRQGAVNLPGARVVAEEEGFFLVEFILDLADQFFQDVLQGGQADGAAPFVHDDGEVEFSLEKKLEEFLQAGGFGDVN